MKKYLVMLVAIGFLSSCDEDTLQNVNSEVTDLDFALGEVAFTQKSEKTVEAYYLGQLVSLEVIDDTYVLGGDMIIPESQLSFVAPPEDGPSEESVGRTGGRWPNNTVPYTINSNLPNTSRVTNAIAEWESKTNIKFVPRTNQSDYVEFRAGSGCSSFVGRIGGRQTINLASGCSTGNNIHEIGHAIGLYHEHTRADRNTYVTVNFNNIRSGFENNFQTYVQRGTDGRDYTNTLDFGSIMMYSSFAFSNNGQPTITRKNGSTFTTQRNGLSSDDLAGINQMYPASSGGGGAPQYNNGQYYTIDGLRVYRYSNRWWYYTSSNGWREVVNVNGSWFYA